MPFWWIGKPAGPAEHFQIKWGQAYVLEKSALQTPSQSVPQRWFHQCMNHGKKLSLKHPLPTFGNFSFFQASLWNRVDKVLQKLTKSWKSEYRQVFQCCIWIPRKCPCKTPFQHTVPPSPPPSDLKRVNVPVENNWGWIPTVPTCSVGTGLLKWLNDLENNC